MSCQRHHNQNVPSQRLDVDIFASAVDNHQMVPAVHRMLEQVQGRLDAFRASRLDVEMLARPSHRIRRLVVFVEHQQSFNGRIRWDEVRELSIIEFLRGTPKKGVKVSRRRNFFHQNEINLIGRRIITRTHTHTHRQTTNIGSNMKLCSSNDDSPPSDNSDDLRARILLNLSASGSMRRGKK